MKEGSRIIRARGNERFMDSERHNFSLRGDNSIGDSFYRRYTLRALALKFFAEARFRSNPRKALVDSNLAKPRYAEIHAGHKFNRAIVEGLRLNSPIDEGWWLWRLQHDAGQIDVAPAFDVELRIAVDLCLRDCGTERR